MLPDRLSVTYRVTDRPAALRLQLLLRYGTPHPHFEFVPIHNCEAKVHRPTVARQSKFDWSAAAESDTA
jgi:hypothetical protein